MSGDFLWIYSISVRCSLPQACQQALLFAAVLSTSRISCVRHRQIQGIENPSNYSQFFFFGDLFARLFMENLFFLPVECLHRVIEMAFDSSLVAEDAGSCWPALKSPRSSSLHNLWSLGPAFQHELCKAIWRINQYTQWVSIVQAVWWAC